MKEQLIVKGARQHNLKNITVEIPVMNWSLLQACQAAVNLHWRLIPSMQKVKGVM